ncbi:MAG: HNH endonuclease, partial [Nitriliruptoraceae bacterium]
LAEARQLSAASTVGNGEVGALVDLLCALDHAQAAAALLAERVDRHQLAERRTGLTLESLLACQAPLPGPDRRRLLSSARRLRRLPHLARAVQHGLVPGTALTALTSEAARLDAGVRDDLDAGFADHHLLGRLGPDELVDATRDAVDRLAPALRDRDQRRPIEDRFLALQPRLDGSLTGYFELDPESGATVLEAIESAAPPPASGPRDVTAHAHDAAAGGPAVPGGWERRSRGRQRADGLVRIAEDHLAGVLPPLETGANTDADMAGGVAARMGTATATGVGTGKAAGIAGVGTGVGSGAGPDQPAASTRAPAHGDEQVRACGCRTRRAKPRLLVLTDVATLTGHDELAAASQVLWAQVGRAPRLSPTMVRRLASDADLQLILHDGGEILGTTEPTATIPAPVRAAVLARDRGCRFPGCAAPVRYLDLHHVIPREADGPTTVDNLVGLCRRHHTAVTLGRWQLSMTPDGVVTVRRGRRVATSDPPHRCQLPVPVASGSPAGRSAATTRPPPRQISFVAS